MVDFSSEKYSGSIEDMNADRVNTVVFNLHLIKRPAFFLGTPRIFWFIVKEKPSSSRIFSSDFFFATAFPMALENEFSNY